MGNKSAGQLKKAGMRHAPPVTDNWYTLLDVTDKGYLITFGAWIDTAPNITYVHLKVTIDGNAPDIIDFYDAFGFALCFCFDYGGARAQQVRFPLNMRFNTSLKVEVMVDTASTDLRAACLYTIDY